MNDTKVLYEMKKLEKVVMRSLLEDCVDFVEGKQILLTPTQMQIVDYILEHRDQAIYQRDLEGILKLRRATVSGVLQTMERNGLIRRIYKADDGRTKQIILHEKTKQIFFEHNIKLKNIEEQITQNISKQELGIFLSVLTQMQKNMQAIAKMDLKKGE